MRENVIERQLAMAVKMVQRARPGQHEGRTEKGLSLNRKTLNRKVRHQGKDALQHGDYKRVCRTLRMVDFT